MVKKRIGPSSAQPVLVNIEATAEILAELSNGIMMMNSSVEAGAIQQAIHRLNQLPDPFFKRFPELFPNFQFPYDYDEDKPDMRPPPSERRKVPPYDKPGFRSKRRKVPPRNKPGSIPSSSHNRQVATSLSQFLDDAGLLTPSDAKGAKPPTGAIAGFRWGTGVPEIDPDKTYPTKWKATETLRNLLKDRIVESDPEYLAYRADPKRDIEVWKKINRRVLTKFFAETVVPNIIQAVKTDTKMDPKAAKELLATSTGQLHITDEAYETLNQPDPQRKPGRPSKQPSIDVSAPFLSLGTSEAVPAIGETIGEISEQLQTQAAVGKDFDPNTSRELANIKSQADVSTQKTTIRHKARVAFYDAHNFALNKMKHYGKADERNYIKLIWDRIYSTDVAMATPTNQRVTMEEVRNMRDLLVERGLLNADKTIIKKVKASETASLVHNKPTPAYVKPTTKGRNAEEIGKVLMINNSEDLIVPYGTYSEAVLETGDESFVARFQKNQRQYGGQQKKPRKWLKGSKLSGLPLVIGTLAGAGVGLYTGRAGAAEHERRARELAGEPPTPRYGGLSIPGQVEQLFGEGTVQKGAMEMSPKEKEFHQASQGRDPFTIATVGVPVTPFMDRPEYLKTPLTDRQLKALAMKTSRGMPWKTNQIFEQYKDTRDKRIEQKRSFLEKR